MNLKIPSTLPAMVRSRRFIILAYPAVARATSQALDFYGLVLLLFYWRYLEKHRQIRVDLVFQLSWRRQALTHDFGTVPGSVTTTL